MSTFQTDSLKFDQELSISEQERNIILSTGLNKQNIRKLAKKIFAELMKNVSEEKNEEENFKPLFCLGGIFYFYNRVVGNDVAVLKSEFGAMINEASLDRKKRKILESFLIENNYHEINIRFIARYNNLMRRSDNSISSSGETELMSTSSIWGSEKLVLIYADIISQYLQELGGTQSENIQKSVSMKTSEIFILQRRRENGFVDLRKRLFLHLIDKGICPDCKKSLTECVCKIPF